MNALRYFVTVVTLALALNVQAQDEDEDIAYSLNLAGSAGRRDDF